MFISNLIRKLFGKERRYSLKFSEKPIVGAPREEDIPHYDILHPWAIEKRIQERTEVFRFSRKTVDSLLNGIIEAKPVITN